MTKEKGIVKHSEKDRGIFFDMPEFNNDQQIWLGQSIMSLIAVNRPDPAFSDDFFKETTTILMTEVMQHFGITLDEAFKLHVLNNVLDPDFDYKIKVNLSYEILDKKER